MSFLGIDELAALGFASVGVNCKISRKASFYGAGAIHIGDNTRIDDFCIVTAGEPVFIGSNIHIAAHTCLFGGSGITMEDNSFLSMRVTILSESDDYSGAYLVSPQHEDRKRNVQKGRVLIKAYGGVGAHSVVMPGVTIHQGGVAGAMSFVTRDIGPWEIHAGVPAKFKKERSSRCLTLR